ncbi:PorT family protein [Flavobacterium sp. F-380]|uniref:PorT family protein n=1 Tax=Flavobacterium kayseriense TaxID=2764714 RepID=A0ABR7J6E4_9FLAO|nr:porin family protein [Flavobacterium kayseriense]MBC5841109.1 PorT family protein [Flavobacterium kayseriense]MBC5847637.1 PorT family protein [Flavobacterium kayseriense]
MKKILLVAVLAVLGFVSGNAQEIKFGAKAGLNFASVRGENSDVYDTVTAFNLGAVAEIPLSEKISFQPEILFSGQGYSFGNDIAALNYLNVPLMGKYYVTKGLSLEAGPQVGFLLSAKTDNADVKNLFKKIDFGVNAGLGYKLENGLNFSARYNLGLSNISSVANTTNKNAVVQLSVGYFFL